MKVFKFGGSSVANADRIDNVARIVQSYSQKGEEFSVVVSALGGVTDLLIRMATLAANGNSSYSNTLEAYTARHREVVNALIDYDQHPAILNEIIEGQVELGNLLQGVFLTRELTPRTLDYILSFGERSSAFILSQVLRQYGTHSYYVDARTVIKTNDNFGSAKIYADETYDNIRNLIQNNSGIAVITGFIASTRNGFPTTLGRGGSDYTASIFGSALQVEEIVIWTDVDGVMTADPRRVKSAFPVTSMTYEEAMEMSHFGARVIYPPTIIPALEKNIPIRIKNSFNPDGEGTLISDKRFQDNYIVKGISSISSIALLTLQGSGLFGASSIAARLFNVLANKQVNAILITQGSSQHSISFAVEPAQAEIARISIEDEFALEMQAHLIMPVKIDKELSVVSAIGENMKSRPGISARLFQALGKNGINVIMTAQGSSERNISVVINQEDEAKALVAIHDVFFLSDFYSLNLYIVGVGLIGGTLLEQFKKQAQYLLEKQYVHLNVVALANSRQMLFQPDGIPLDTWKEDLAAASETTDLNGFVDKMIGLNLPNSVFIDNTADANIIDLYPKILEASISISTPNKVATSSKYADYENLKRIADQRGVKFFYETNVGAGLPVITTIQDLVNSGDRILKIEGVLSGSLSFIFNSFSADKIFSEIVTEARTLGYTEPDPRQDLSGMDVARKLTILARESGRSLERESIEIESILSESCMNATSVEAFMEALTIEDALLTQRAEVAAQSGKVLRFIATLEDEKAFISLQEVGKESPFYNLSGSDNMIVFTTERYRERPLVIKGPGAGAEVTAAGVFAEILRIGYYLS